MTAATRAQGSASSLREDARAAVMVVVKAKPGSKIHDIAKATGMRDVAVRRCLKTLADRGALDVTNGKAYARLPVMRSRPGLEADHSVGLHERRRFDCMNLDTCEDTWIRERCGDKTSGEKHAAEQAKCPAGCPFYVQEARREDEGVIGCTHDAEVMGL